MACATEDKKNIGVSRCKEMPGAPKCMITVPANFSCTEEELLDPAFWQALLLAAKASRGYLYPTFKGFENLSSEAVYEDTPYSYEPVDDGQYRFRFMLNDGLCTHKATFTHRGSGDRVILIDKKNKAIATKKADGTYTGFIMDMINPEKLILSDGTVSTKSPILVALADNNELDRNGVMFDGSFLLQLERLTDASLTIIGTPSATEVEVSVANACDETEILGLLTADFIFRDAAGVAQTVTSAPTADGTYLLTGTSLDTGVLSLRAPSLLTVKAYEGIPVTVTI